MDQEPDSPASITHFSPSTFENPQSVRQRALVVWMTFNNHQTCKSAPDDTRCNLRTTQALSSFRCCSSPSRV